MGIAAISVLSSNGLILHLVGYAVTTMAAFTAIIVFYNLTAKDEIPDFAGLADRSPLLAASLAVAFFSLAGLPFFAGFTTKFYLFTAVAEGGFLWLSGLAATTSLISLYYYLIVIKQMYIQPVEDTTPLQVPRVMACTLGILLLAIILIGIYPGPLVDAIEVASKAILPLERLTAEVSTSISGP